VLQLATKEAEERTKKMANAISWWAETYEEAEEAKGEVKVEGVEEMKRVMDWGSSHQDYKPPTFARCPQAVARPRRTPRGRDEGL
jgi:hypothetical protein